MFNIDEDVCEFIAVVPDGWEYEQDEDEVKIIADDWLNMVITGDVDTWDEFVRIHLNQYRNKMRKKPKHFAPIQNHIRRYKDLCEWGRRKKHTIEPFHIYALKQNCPDDSDYDF